MVKTSINVVFHTIKVFILFVSFTILFYFGMIWLNQEYKNYHRYDEPKGSAVKVSTEVHPNREEAINRLLLFYTNGE